MLPFDFDAPAVWAKRMQHALGGQWRLYNDFRDYALNDTPFVSPKPMLRHLDGQGVVEVESIAERRRGSLPRIDLLRQSPAQVRFLSIEPLLEHLGPVNLKGINWVIVGGESGLGARPMDAGWVRGIRQQCRKAGVAFFFKQWGGVHKSENGRELDGRTYDEFPERGQAPVPSPELRLAALDQLEAKFG